MNGMLKSKHLDLAAWVLLVSGIWDTCNQLSLGKTAYATNEPIAKGVKASTRLQKSNWTQEDHSSCTYLDQETCLQILKSVGINKNQLSASLQIQHLLAEELPKTYHIC